MLLYGFTRKNALTRRARRARRAADAPIEPHITARNVGVKLLHLAGFAPREAKGHKFTGQ